MTLLTPGANTGVNTQTLNVTVSYSSVSGAELDVSAFLLTASGKEIKGVTDAQGQTAKIASQLAESVTLVLEPQSSLVIA